MTKVLYTACMLLCICAAGWTQSSTATVHGVVTDPTKAVIPGASVTLTGTETGVERKTVTNESGLYAFAAVIPGLYRIKIESPGMQAYEATLTVQVQVDAVVNAALTVGQSTARVE